MKLLIGTPHMANHYDAGLFWVQAFSHLGHTTLLWDYRMEAWEPKIVEAFQPDLTIIFKGESVNPDDLPAPKICYYPDDLERIPDIEKKLIKYDWLFTPCRPTPVGMIWLPSGWDPKVHHNNNIKRYINTIYVGTRNSTYKESMIKAIHPEGLAGNGWGKDMPPLYTDNLVNFLNQGKVLINLHQNSQVGVNRKFFEMIACGLTITDRPPGVAAILGEKLTQMLTFETASEARNLAKKLLALSSEERHELWMRELRKITPYTYTNLAMEMIQCVE